MIFPDASIWIQWLNLLVLLFLLNRFLFRPILQRMEERNRAIQGNLDAAAADRGEAEKRMAEYEEAIGRARHEGMESLLRLEKEVREEVRRKLDERRSEADRMAEDARRRIEIQSHEAEKGLEGRIRELAGDIGRRLAGREIRV